MINVPEILKKYHIDPERGFLPGKDPSQKLPEQFESWESLAENLSEYLKTERLREKIDSLPLINDPGFETDAEWERAMLLLSYFAHSYVHAPPSPSTHIPDTIAIPWIKVSKHLRRKPILSHSSSVLNNWRRTNLAKPISIGNMETLIQFYGSPDERWFFLITIEIEYAGAIAIPLMLEIINCVEEGDYINATRIMDRIHHILISMTDILEKMYDGCDPEVFYTSIRPFLASFEGIRYEGTELEPQSHHGGSAAQSSLIQFFDAALGIRNEDPDTREYLELMRKHMPYKHAEFLEYVEGCSSIGSKYQENEEFKNSYETCLNLLLHFRNTHYKMVAVYIMKQAKKSQAEAVGTGGTSPMEFLNSVKSQVKKRLG